MSIVILQTSCKEDGVCRDDSPENQIIINNENFSATDLESGLNCTIGALSMPNPSTMTSNFNINNLPYAEIKIEVTCKCGELASKLRHAEDFQAVSSTTPYKWVAEENIKYDRDQTTHRIMEGNYRTACGIPAENCTFDYSGCNTQGTADEVYNYYKIDPVNCFYTQTMSGGIFDTFWSKGATFCCQFV